MCGAERPPRRYDRVHQAAAQQLLKSGEQRGDDERALPEWTTGEAHPGIVVEGHEREDRQRGVQQRSDRGDATAVRERHVQALQHADVDA